MSDYIPTTADVRDAYSSESSDSTYANRMFDAWLAKYKAKQIAKAEERIIKLLEDEREKHIPWCGKIQPCPECHQTVGLEKAIALIKGENK